MENDYEIELTCNDCDTPVFDHHRYCMHCGAYLGAQASTINVFNNQPLRRIFTFFFIYLFVCLVVKETDWFNSYDELFWVEVLLAVITLHFCYLNRRLLRPVLRFTSFKWSILLGTMAIAAIGSTIVSFTVREVNVTFFQSEVSYYQGYKLYVYPVLVMIYSIALMPALFEELAFRGVMYNYCTTFLSDRLAVAVTAFLFAIMHLNLISLIWLIPFGFFIGHLRRRYNTIWYGVLFHFVFNLTACIIDLYREGELFIF